MGTSISPLESDSMEYVALLIDESHYACDMGTDLPEFTVDIMNDTLKCVLMNLTDITVYNRRVLKNGSCCTVRPGKVSCFQKFRHFWMIIRDMDAEG